MCWKSIMGPSHFEMSAVAKLVMERMGSMMTIPMAQESTQVVKQTKQIRLFQMEIQNIQSSNLPKIQPNKNGGLFCWTSGHGHHVTEGPRPRRQGRGSSSGIRIVRIRKNTPFNRSMDQTSCIRTLLTFALQFLMPGQEVILSQQVTNSLPDTLSGLFSKAASLEFGDVWMRQVTISTS